MAIGKWRDTAREARWRRVVGEYTRSGLSVREFCHRNRLRESAFYYWRRELQRRQAEQQQCRSAEPPATPAFVAVRVEEQAVAATPDGRIEIELSGGRRVHVVAPVDRQALADVLAVLEARPC